MKRVVIWLKTAHGQDVTLSELGRQAAWEALCSFTGETREELDQSGIVLKKHPNGKPGTVSYDRTAVVNKLQEEALETYQVSYYLTNTDTECYKCYTVHADDMVPVPKDPVVEGKTFTGWADAEGNALDQNMTMTQDAAYYAVWN